MSGSKRKELSVEGVIFQCTPEFIVFEFRFDGEEAIGMVPTSNIILRNGERIPRGSYEKSSLGRYLEVGDEIKCRVNRNLDSSKVIYVEKEKGQEKVMIRPEWTADKAYLLSPLRHSSTNHHQTEGESEGGNEDLRTLLQCRKIKKSRNSKDDVPKSSSSNGSRIRDKGSRESSPRRRSSNYEDRGRSSTSRSRKFDSNDERSKGSRESNSRSTPFYRAQLLAIKKPGRNKQYVTGGIMEIIDDHRYSGKRAFFCNNSLYIYGHPLGRADLSYYLRKGDEFNVEINDLVGSLTIKRAWVNAGRSVSFEEELSTPPRIPAKCPHFRNWLRSRDITFNEFTDWILGKTPVKPYFPFQSPCFTGVLKYVVKEESPQGDGGIIRIVSDGKYKDKLVVFDRSDLYIEGVSVGNADLRILLRPGDVVNAQVLEMSTADRKRYWHMIKGEDVTLCGQLCFVGNVAPNDPYGVPEESERLSAYLSAVGLSMSEFTLMRSSSQIPPKHSEQKSVEETTSGMPLSGPMTFIKTLTDNLPIQEHNKIMFALSLTVRALRLSSPSDPKAMDLLQTPEDIANAVSLSKIFTQVLVKKMQTKMRAKIMQNFGTCIGSTLKDQEKQLASYELIQTQEEEATTDLSGPEKKSERGTSNIVEMMKKVEKQIESVKPIPSSSGKAPKRNMKKILESYASSKGSANNELSNLKPLELLHHFIRRNKTIALRNEVLYFGELGYSINTISNFPMGDSKLFKKFYTIYDLYFFWRHQKLEHSVYRRMAEKEKVNCVFEEDRKRVTDFFMGDNPQLLNGNGEPSTPPPMEDAPKKMKLSLCVPSSSSPDVNASLKEASSRWIPSFSLASTTTECPLESPIPHPVKTSLEQQIAKPKIVGFKSSFSYGSKELPGTGFSSAFDSSQGSCSFQKRKSTFFGHAE